MYFRPDVVKGLFVQGYLILGTAAFDKSYYNIPTVFIQILKSRSYLLFYCELGF